MARPPSDRDPESSRPSGRRHWRCTSHCRRTYIGKLEAEGVIQRQGDGFPLDQSRAAYLRHLRRERQQSPRNEADVAHAMAKTELLQVRIMEKKKVLMLVADHEALVETVVGVFL